MKREGEVVCVDETCSLAATHRRFLVEGGVVFESVVEEAHLSAVLCDLRGRGVVGTKAHDEARTRVSARSDFLIVGIM